MSILLYLIPVLLLIMLILQIRYNLFVPAARGLPILVYHRVSEVEASRACVTVDQLEQQFRYIAEKKYTCIRLADVLNPAFKLPAKPLIITFDDGYLDNLQYLYPMLLKYGLKASIMLPSRYIGHTSDWEGGHSLPLMDYTHLKQMDPGVIEFGLHSYSHFDLAKLTTQAVTADLVKCMETLRENGINFVPALAYPFGKYPRKEPEKSVFFDALREAGVEMGMRIGNKYNPSRIKDWFEVKRISVKGNESFWHFRTKLKKGRVKMF